MRQVQETSNRILVRVLLIAMVICFGVDMGRVALSFFHTQHQPINSEDLAHRVGNPVYEIENRSEMWHAIHVMNKFPDGIVHFGDDGVIRSLNSHKTVLQFYQLNNVEVRRATVAALSLTFLDADQTRHRRRVKELDKFFEHVDGHDVTNSFDLWLPSKEIETAWEPIENINSLLKFLSADEGAEILKSDGNESKLLTPHERDIL